MDEVEEEDEDVFEDAVEEHNEPKKQNSSGIPVWIEQNGSPPSGLLPLDEDIALIHKAMDVFFNNKFDEVTSSTEPYLDCSIYQAMGHAFMSFVNALMTFEPQYTTETNKLLNRASESLEKFRRKTGFTEAVTSLFTKTDFDRYTDAELHAEAAYAELLIFRAALTIIEEESIMSLVRGMLKIRSSYQIFKDLAQALRVRDWSDTDPIRKREFEGSVFFTSGIFNVMMSLLPPRVIKMAEVVGFHGDREKGIRELTYLSENKSIRRFPANMFLCQYHLIISTYVGNIKADPAFCKKIIDESLEVYPSSCIFMILNARYFLVIADIEQAIKWYTDAMTVQNHWPQFHHFCYWELCWANMFSLNWWEAVKYSKKLFSESNWSKAVYAYHVVAASCMVQDELSEEQKSEQIELAKNIPSWKQRFGGKSLPQEKFSIVKAERFLKQGYLVLPAIEVVYAWNGFNIIGKSQKLTEDILGLVKKERKNVGARKGGEYYLDDLCLVTLLEAVCLKSLGDPSKSEDLLKEVISHAGNLKSDTYLIPYATLEYGIILGERGDVDAAIRQLEKAKNDYSDYQLISRLHFRVHSALAALKE